MICCEALNSQMFNDFRRAAREGQAARSALLPFASPSCQTFYSENNRFFLRQVGWR